MIALACGQPEVEPVAWLRPHVGDLSDGRPLFLAPRTSATKGQRPVLERELLHATELGSAVRDEPEPERARVSVERGPCQPPQRLRACVNAPSARTTVADH
jgi:hypothetical protein